MIDEPRRAWRAVGDLDRFLKFKAAKAMGDAAAGQRGRATAALPPGWASGSARGSA